MPSLILNGPASGFTASGCASPVNILSGAFGALWSGTNRPLGSIGVRWDIAASGNCYILADTQCLLSGNMTQNSGTYLASGICGLGISDGMALAAGMGVSVQKASLNYDSSGNPQIWVSCDAACSGGNGRLYWHADMQIVGK